MVPSVKESPSPQAKACAYNFITKGTAMQIRTFQPGDEAAQVEVYNTAAAALPKFKPATVVEVQRRTRGADFDPGQRFYAVENGKVVGYCLVNANGRVSYPWCLPGHESCAEPLFARVLEAAGQRKLFAAYRGDWPAVQEFFLGHGFVKAREMVSFLIDIVDLPTPSAHGVESFTAVARDDAAALMALYPAALRVRQLADWQAHLFDNPYFKSDALFALRAKSGTPLAVGIAVYDPTYADPRAVDAAMPCFRLGAFGTEGMQTKRLKGMFSFLARPDASLPSLAIDLLGHAAWRMRDHDDVTALAAQAPSDAPALLNFYERHFRKQGSFPVFERG